MRKVLVHGKLSVDAKDQRGLSRSAVQRQHEQVRWAVRRGEQTEAEGWGVSPAVLTLAAPQNHLGSHIPTT